MMIQIKQAFPNDYPMIQKMAYTTWNVVYKDIISKEQMIYMLEMIYSLNSLKEQVNQKKHCFIIAKENNSYLGFASYQINYPLSFKTRIHKLYVLPTAQGKGLGKLLINHISKIAKQNKSTTLHLNVNKQNEALNFYKKLGFKIVLEEIINIGNGFVMDDYVMEKNIEIDL